MKKILICNLFIIIHLFKLKAYLLLLQSFNINISHYYIICFINSLLLSSFTLSYSFSKLSINFLLILNPNAIFHSSSMFTFFRQFSIIKKVESTPLLLSINSSSFNLINANENLYITLNPSSINVSKILTKILKSKFLANKHINHSLA